VKDGHLAQQQLLLPLLLLGQAAVLLQQQTLQCLTSSPALQGHRTSNMLGQG
jgi:hypothetical protein